LAVGASPNAWGRMAAVGGQAIPDVWAKPIHALGGLTLLFWTLAAPWVLIADAYFRDNHEGAYFANHVQHFVSELFRVAFFVTALLCLVVMSLTLGAVAAGRRRGLPTYPRRRLRLCTLVNPWALMICCISLLLLASWYIPVFGLAAFFEPYFQLFGEPNHLGDVAGNFVLMSTVWFGILANFAVVKKIHCGRASCTAILRVGIVLLWIFMGATIVLVMWQVGGPSIVMMEDPNSGLEKTSIEWVSGGLPGVRLAARFFLLGWAALGILTSCTADGFSGIQRWAREQQAAVPPAGSGTARFEEASDAQRRHQRLMRLWRGVSKAAPKLIRAQQRAAERVFAPDGNGFQQAWGNFRRLARVEALASPLCFTQALASMRFSGVVMSSERSGRSASPTSSPSRIAAQKDAPPCQAWAVL